MTSYEAARIEINAAEAAYRIACSIFQAGGSDEDFNAAAATIKAARARFDEAYEAACADAA